MAPVGERTDRESSSGPQNGDEEGSNLWASILSEVQSRSATKLQATKNILVLGENESGKTTLVSRLQGNEDPKKGSGLEYLYINVKDEYRDDQTRLGAWLLDGDLHHRGLLKFALNEDNFAHTLVLLVASLNNPWSVMESLQNWAEVLTTHVDRLKLPKDQLNEYKESLVRHFQDYTKPEDSASSKPRRTEDNPLHPAPHKTEDEKVLLPLSESTLSHNLGIPIIVILTKTDAISSLEKEHDYREEHFDFIQQHIRKFCLNYGAALCYTSVRDDRNCDLLNKYIAHRIYGFPFTADAQVVERDSVFIPTGWDNEKKISILYENMSGMSPNDPYEDVIARPMSRKPMQRDAEIAAEDEQLFLMKLQTQLSKTPTPSAAPGGNRESPMRSGSSVQKSNTSPRVTSSPSNAGIGPSPKKMEAGKQGGAPGNENVLANFFNSLLTKKAGAETPATPGKPTDRSAVNRDAAAELDRMTRSKKPTVTLKNQSPHNNSSSA
ncbi:hypothetical protein CAPTEDRAFT_20224 [Capitella teleta]|uniref:Dynein light intermediate chain n=1 Tax=Capitella teleta TaxID=283909 RepID=R7UJC4_CAPTE|nr:hypothetical protein CAPTEDRAFT_20224 [Capitella teleta]|eukprot:ELU06193.1 hypothetical protein CAPTEDRAFT_20224 [Capitella teleta]